MNKVPIWHLKFYMGGPTYNYEAYVAEHSAEGAMDFIRKTHTAYSPFFFLVELTNMEVMSIVPSKP